MELKKIDEKLFNCLMRNRRLLLTFSLVIYPLILLFIYFFIDEKYEKYEFLKELGSLAFYLLMFILIAKPIIKIFNLKILEKYLIFRRELGIITFYTALFHSFSILILSDFDFYLTLNWIKVNGSFIFGLIALIILFLLFITSNSYTVRVLGKYWKYLHSLVYIVPILILLHLFFQTPEESYEAFPLVAVFYLLKFIEIIKSRKKKSRTKN